MHLLSPADAGEMHGRACEDRGQGFCRLSQAQPTCRGSSALLLSCLVSGEAWTGQHPWVVTEPAVEGVCEDKGYPDHAGRLPRAQELGALGSSWPGGHPWLWLHHLCHTTSPHSDPSGGVSLIGQKGD